MYQYSDRAEVRCRPGSRAPRRQSSQQLVHHDRGLSVAPIGVTPVDHIDQEGALSGKFTVVRSLRRRPAAP